MASRTWHQPGPTVWLQGGAPNYLGAGPTSTIGCAGVNNPTCYVVVQENGYQPDGAPTAPGVVPGFQPFRSTAYRSSDDGRSWTELNLPPATWLSSPISCVNATTCAAGAVLDAGGSAGTPGSEVRFLTTTDAGRSWTQHSMPSWVELVTDVACPSASHCVALTWHEDAPDIDGLEPWAGADRFYATTVLITEDGGGTWTASSLPGRSGARYVYLSDVTCVDQQCAFLGDEADIVPFDGGYLTEHTKGVVLSSDDGGHTLGVTDEPAGVPWAVACAGPSDCLMFVTNLRTGTWSVLTGAVEGPWQQVEARGLAAISAPVSVSCPASGRCVASGTQVVVTTDDGTRWSQMTSLPSPPNGYTANSPGGVACSPSGRCLLLDGLTPTSTLIAPGPGAVQVLANGLPAG